MNRARLFSLLVPLLLVAIAAIAASPREEANRIRKIDSRTNALVLTNIFAPAKVAPSLSALMPPTVLPRAIVRPPKPFHLTLLCDKGPPSTAGYQWLKGTNGQIYGLTGTTTNNWFTVSNLFPEVSYVFVATAIDTNGQISVYSLPVYWPQPKTNYFAFGDSVYTTGPWRTNAIVAVNATNSKAFYRGQRRGGLYEVISSTDLKMWTPPITNWGATNVVMANVLRFSHWSNWDYAKSD